MTGQRGEQVNYLTVDGRLHIWSLTLLDDETLANIPSQMIDVALEEAKQCLDSAVDWDWTDVPEWIAMVGFLQEEWDRYDQPEEWTVESLGDHLRKLQIDGRGHQQVYIYRGGDSHCMPVTRASVYHDVKYGHVVLGSDDPKELET